MVLILSPKDVKQIKLKNCWSGQLILKEELQIHIRTFKIQYKHLKRKKKKSWETFIMEFKPEKVYRA